MVQALKDTYSMIDLYGSSIFIEQLKQSFKTVAFTQNSIPTPGSPCKSSALVRDDLKVETAIFHRSGEVTIKTDKGVLKFF